jgi:UDPglucose 6-dehydrogenase
VARGRRVRFACSPENLRLGQALEIFRNPTRIVIGVRDTHARDILEPLLSPFSKRLIFMSVESAEMVKHAVNAFLAVSVTFANEIAAICEKVGAEATDVEKALRSEPRIGEKAYVRPGPAFAGGTLARDIRFLSSIAECAQVQAPLIESVIPSNRAHRKWAINQLRERLRPLKNRRIAVLGLSYKPGTNSMRRSAAIELLHDLAHEDVEISAFDPAVRALPKELNGKVTLTPDLASALKNSEAVVIATEWPEFRTLSEADFAAACDGCLVLDPGRYLDPTLAQAKRFRVISVGTAV